MHKNYVEDEDTGIFLIVFAQIITTEVMESVTIKFLRPEQSSKSS